MAGAIGSISGLASGLDTSTIVSQLMAIERQPLVRLQQSQRVEQARHDALALVQTKLQTLSDAVAGLNSVTAWGDTQTVESSSESTVAASRIGGAAAGGYAVVVTNLATADQIVQNGAFTTAPEATKLTISVGGADGGSVEVTVDAGDDAAKIASKINGSSKTPVYASVINGKLTLSGKTTGTAAAISVTAATTGTGYNVADDLFDFGTVTHRNHDATISVDGVNKLGVSKNTIDDLIPGVKLTFKATGSATVTVGAPGPDTDAVQKNLQTFVDAYNDAVTTISSKLNEQRAANPTTDAERAKGVLSADPGLSALLSALRGAVGAPLGSGPATMKLLSQAGVSTGASTGTGPLNADAIAGKLTIDSETLSTALGASFADVKSLVTGAGGLSSRLKTQLDPWLYGNGSVGPIIDSRIDSSSQAISRFTGQQADLQVRLDAYQKRLESQFTAMETALSTAQSQASWLASQLASL